MMAQDQERCGVCGVLFRMEDAVGIYRDELVHARCLPRTPRFVEGEDEELDDTDDSAPAAR